MHSVTSRAIGTLPPADVKQIFSFKCPSRTKRIKGSASSPTFLARQKYFRLFQLWVEVVSLILLIILTASLLTRRALDCMGPWWELSILLLRENDVSSLRKATFATANVIRKLDRGRDRIEHVQRTWLSANKLHNLLILYLLDGNKQGSITSSSLPAFLFTSCPPVGASELIKLAATFQLGGKLLVGALLLITS